MLPRGVRDQEMDFARVMRGSNFAQRAGVATLDFVKAFSKRFQQSSWNAFRCDTFADIVLPHGHISLFGGVAVAAVAVIGRVLVGFLVFPQTRLLLLRSSGLFPRQT